MGKLPIEIAKESFYIMLRPEQHWQKIKTDSTYNPGVFSRFFFPGLVMIFVSVIIGTLLFNSSFGFLPIDTMIKALREVLLVLMTFVASTMILYEVSRWYHIPMGFETARRVIIYSMLPFFAISIITGFFPFLTYLEIFSIYSFYLLYLALTTIYEITPYRKMGYLIILFAGILLSYIVIALLLSILTALIVY